MYLSDKKQCVVLNGVTSRPQPVPSGVPQRSVLRPFLFYLVQQQSGWSATVWGLQIGDLLLYKPVESNADYNQVQEDVPIIDHWMSHNFLMLNATNGS